MGQTLSEPNTAKESAYLQNEEYRVGSSCMQGWRVNMEDSHTHILSLPDDPGTAFFAVYDGHGGANVADFAGKNLHKFILARPEYLNDLTTALKNGFLDIDDELLKKNDFAMNVGSTAVVAMIKNGQLYCANAGDSRAIACINGKVVNLSEDHKPNNEEEQKRIVEGGGFVEFNRVNGNLALSRALGDFSFKRNRDKRPEEQIVTAFPDVVVHDITEDWEFILLACDGIWDVMNSEDVMGFVRTRIGEGKLPEAICEELMQFCLAPNCQLGGLGGDNMTVVLVCLLHNKPYSELVARCKVGNRYQHISEKAPLFQEENDEMTYMLEKQPSKIDTLLDGKSETSSNDNAEHEEKNHSDIREPTDITENNDITPATQISSPTAVAVVTSPNASTPPSVTNQATSAAVTAAAATATNAATPATAY